MEMEAFGKSVAEKRTSTKEKIGARRIRHIGGR
jgi:hypothetical protein